MKHLIGAIINSAAIIFLALTIINQPKIGANPDQDSISDKQATSEQLVILHYIKHHIGSQENEMMFEHSDGIITEKDYHDVLERVHKKFNIDGFNDTYTRK